MYKNSGNYERTAMKLLKHSAKPKPFCIFENGKLLVGQSSLHQTKAGRNYRLFWRIKLAYT
jgi:hypothetical protein